MFDTSATALVIEPAEELARLRTHIAALLTRIVDPNGALTTKGEKPTIATYRTRNGKWHVDARWRWMHLHTKYTTELDAVRRMYGWLRTQLHARTVRDLDALDTSDNDLPHLATAPKLDGA